MDIIATTRSGSKRIKESAADSHLGFRKWIRINHDKKLAAVDYQNTNLIHNRRIDRPSNFPVHGGKIHALVERT